MQSDRPSHYHRVAAYVVQKGGMAITLTYAQIEALIGESLPLAAVYGTPWWTTTTMLNVRRWREHAWGTYPDRTLREVRFVRDVEVSRDGD